MNDIYELLGKIPSDMFERIQDFKDRKEKRKKEPIKDFPSHPKAEIHAWINGLEYFEVIAEIDRGNCIMYLVCKNDLTTSIYYKLEDGRIMDEKRVIVDKDYELNFLFHQINEYKKRK